ncbi:cerebellin-1 domain [Caudoviricetes sp.]|nr:cerebellin-1 domain [Caudoviricetes sp.]
MATQKPLTRDQLAKFLPDHEAIKAFERLFQIVENLSPSDIAILTRLIEDTGLNAGVADNKGDRAISNVAQVDAVEFNQNPAAAARLGQAKWNKSDQTLDLRMEYGVTQQIGQEQYARVGNTTGVTIPNGTVVGFVGATSNALLVSPYLADGSAPSLYILGVMTHDLPDSGQKGYCTTWGFVRDLDTSAFSAGDILYASPTVAGAFTNVKPTAPDNVIPIAACIISDATNGLIFVRPTVQQMQYYGEFTKTTDQSPAAVNTEYLLTFDNTEISNGVTIGTPTSRIVVPESGLYQFDATLQLTSTSSSAKNIWVWMKKNGTALPNSARLVTSDLNNGYIPIAIGETISLAANDYVELAFASDSTAVTVDTVAATAFAPASPAIVLSVTQVQQ